MSTRKVTTQAELDQALADRVELIEIHSPSGVWLTILENESSRVVAWDSSSVEARGSSRVEAFESSRVEAFESSRVEARESSSVVARESSSVEAFESSRVVARESSRVVACGSSRVEAFESSRVVAWDSSSVVAWDSSSVEARGSSRVEACGSSRVEAFESSRVVAHGSSSVVAWDSSSVVAWDSSSVEAREASTVSAFGGTVKATPLVAVHLRSATVDVKGGVIIDHTHVHEMDGAAWCEYHGIKVKRGVATLFKAVNDQWTTDRGTDYSPGSKPKCADFKDTDACGNGLHFGPSPSHARSYFERATKYLAVGVKVSELRPINGSVAKAKAPRVVRACVEVDINGKPVEVTP